MQNTSFLFPKLVLIFLLRSRITQVQFLSGNRIMKGSQKVDFFLFNILVFVRCQWLLICAVHLQLQNSVILSFLVSGLRCNVLQGKSILLLDSRRYSYVEGERTKESGMSLPLQQHPFVKLHQQIYPKDVKTTFFLQLCELPMLGMVWRHLPP